MELKLAKIDDFDFFYEIKCEKVNMFWAGYDITPPRINILSFFNRCLEEQIRIDKKKIYIVWNNGDTRVGYVYIEPSGIECDTAVAIKEEFSGKGYGKTAVEEASKTAKKLGFKRMVGHIREDNIASQKVYSKCGFTISEEYITKYLPSVGKEVKMYAMYIDL